METLAGDTDEEGGHLHELEMRETPKESNRKERGSGNLLPRKKQRLALFCKKAGRVALQVCANMKKRAQRKGNTLFSMCTALGQEILDYISSNLVLDEWGQWEYGEFGV